MVQGDKDNRRAWESVFTDLKERVSHRQLDWRRNEYLAKPPTQATTLTLNLD